MYVATYKHRGQLMHLCLLGCKYLSWRKTTPQRHDVRHFPQPGSAQPGNYLLRHAAAAAAFDLVPHLVRTRQCQLWPPAVRCWVHDAPHMLLHVPAPGCFLSEPVDNIYDSRSRTITMEVLKYTTVGSDE